MKKIMFNDKYGLTQAVLEGRKTQTRRVIEMPQDDIEYLDEAFDWEFRESVIIDRYAKYKVGEIVAVAQKYADCGGLMEDGTPRWKFIARIAGEKNGGWSNKMFIKPELMPHQVIITNVRIERLQEISDEDCLNEGIEFDGKAQSFYCGFNASTNSKIWLGSTPREAYAVLIDKVNGKGTWGSNPYVFVDNFKLLK